MTVQSNIRFEQSPGASGRNAKAYLFVLVPDFSLMSLTTSLETLQALNDAVGFGLARWSLCTPGGQAVRSSVGLKVPVDGDLPKVPRGTTIVVVGGDALRGQDDPDLIRWLQKSVRMGACVAGLHSASLILARAGLLANRRATIHWNYQDCLIENYPDIQVKQSTYTIHDGISTTAGGTSAIDLFLALIERDHGNDLAEQVAEQINYSSIRVLQEQTSIGVAHRRHIRHPKLNAAVRMMEQCLEEPVSPTLLAGQVGISTRQLERLFQKYLGLSPKKCYMDLRLARAHRLLIHTDLSVTETAVACGFASLSHFSKIFREKYQTSPYRLRNGG